MNEIKMKVLIVEDDPKVCAEFVNEMNKRNNITLCKTTNSSDEAIKLIRNYDYDAIIVDLELHYGKGSGFELLNEIKNLNMQKKPIIIVNTNIISEVVYDKLHAGLVDMIFYKKQDGYSAKHVVDTMISLSENIKIEIVDNNEYPEDKTNLYTELINDELDLIGISYKLKGRKYMFDTILYMLEQNSVDTDETALQYTASKYKLVPNSISRAIQTAINEAWRKTAIEDLREYYTAKIDYNTGVPTPTEFLYYYVEKIRKMTKNH